MINFRFHLVSLIAVFLALGLGILVGSTVVDQVIVDRLDHEISSVSHESNQLNSDNGKLKRPALEGARLPAQVVGVRGRPATRRRPGRDRRRQGDRSRRGERGARRCCAPRAPTCRACSGSRQVAARHAEGSPGVARPRTSARRATSRPLASPRCATSPTRLAEPPARAHARRARRDGTDALGRLPRLHRRQARRARRVPGTAAARARPDGHRQPPVVDRHDGRLRAGAAHGQGADRPRRGLRRRQRRPPRPSAARRSSPCAATPSSPSR